MTTVLSKLAK